MNRRTDISPFLSKFRRWLFILSAVSPGMLQAQPDSIPGYAGTMRGLTEYRRNFLKYSRLATLEDRIARHRLDHSRSLRFTPYFDVGTAGNPSAGMSWEFTGPRWKTQGAFAGRGADAVWGGLAIPLVRSADKKRRILDTLIATMEEQSRLEYQRLLVEDVKVILSRRIHLREVDSQAALLFRGSQRLDSLIQSLSSLVAGGKLAANALEPLRLSQTRLSLRAQVLNKESEFLVWQVVDAYGIAAEVFRDLDVYRLAEEIRKKALQRTGTQRHMFQQIDSVAARARLERANLQLAKELDLWAGVSAGRLSTGADPGWRLFLEINYRFDDKPFNPSASGAHSSQPQPSLAPTLDFPSSLIALQDSISEFRKGMEKSERKVFAEIGLGSWESAFNLNEFVMEFYEQGLQLSRLESESLDSMISLVRSLNDLPPVLQEF